MWETDLETFGKWKNLEGKVQECEESSQIYVTGTDQEGEKNNAKKKKKKVKEELIRMIYVSDEEEKCFIYLYIHSCVFIYRIPFLLSILIISLYLVSVSSISILSLIYIYSHSLT